MLALALMSYVTWALCVRCSPMLFAGATSTRPSYLFLVGLTLGATLFAIAWRFRTARPSNEERPFPLQSAWGVAAAARNTAPQSADDIVPNYIRLSQAERERLERLARQGSKSVK